MGALGSKFDEGGLGGNKFVRGLLQMKPGTGKESDALTCIQGGEPGWCSWLSHKLLVPTQAMISGSSSES